MSEEYRKKWTRFRKHKHFRQIRFNGTSHCGQQDIVNIFDCTANWPESALIKII